MKKIFLILSLGLSALLIAQNNQQGSPIIFIYDASGSMWGQIDGKTKMAIAADVLSNSVNTLPDNQKLGLVAYGHRKKGDCKDVEFLVEVKNGTKSQLTEAVTGIKPLGKTPLAYSASLVIDELRKSKLKATIILITDGIESCDGDICEVVKSAKAEGIEFKLHIIGFGLKDADTKQVKCAAQAGDGNYYEAGNAGDLGEVLNEATEATVDMPDGNFTVYAIKNGVAIDAWVKAYDVVSKRKPIMVRTYKDTGSFYLPPSTYNLEVVPLEGSDVDKITVSGIQSFDNKIGHQTISFDGGLLRIATTNNGENWDCVVKLYDTNDKVAASVRTYTEPKEVEVNPGTYKVSIQALGSMKGISTYTELENISITAGGTTPVSHNFKSGNFEIITRVNGENVDAIVSIKEINTGKKLGGSRTYDRGTKFLLNPGVYEVKAVPLGVHKDKASQTFRITVKAGELISKEVNF